MPMRKTYKQLPFENKKQPRGNLLCADADLRIEPPRSGAMSLAQLRDICLGLASNTTVKKLDLDNNNFALVYDPPYDDDEDPLAPLIELVEANSTLKTLDISNNNLYFGEEDGLLGSVEKLICRGNLTSLVIGGNMNIDDILMRKVGEWVAASGRRWRNISVGSVDADFDAAVVELKAAVRAAFVAAESQAIVGFFNRPRAASGGDAPPAAAVRRHEQGRAASPPRQPSSAPIAAAAVDGGVVPRERERSPSPGPGPAAAETAAAAAVPAAAAPVAGGASMAAGSPPAGASELRWVLSAHPPSPPLRLLPCVFFPPPARTSAMAVAGWQLTGQRGV
jgi:hypothetical protein